MSDYDDRDYDKLAEDSYNEYILQKQLDKLLEKYKSLEKKYDELRMLDMPRTIANLTDISMDIREQNDRLEKALANEIRAVNDLFNIYNEKCSTLRWLVDHSVAAGSISKAKASELLGIPLIDYVNENFKGNTDE